MTSTVLKKVKLIKTCSYSQNEMSYMERSLCTEMSCTRSTTLHQELFSFSHSLVCPDKASLALYSQNFLKLVQAISNSTQILDLKKIYKGTLLLNHRGVNIPDLSGIPDFGSPEVISVIHPELMRNIGCGGYPSSMDGIIKLNWYQEVLISMPLMLKFRWLKTISRCAFIKGGLYPE